jgi:Trk K+ transport system NAD-binding subunit
LAFLRDSRALLSQFRRPLWVFFAAIIVGGLLYGELYAQARGERIPVYNLPYLMIQLMSLQGIPDEAMPNEAALSAFYYIMPALGFYVVGRGLIDFVRVFFDRGARRRAWEVALAAEFRDHIMVLGVGNVGLRVIRTLRDMGFDVVAVDNKPAADRIAEVRKLKVPLIVGDGAAQQTLDEAGIRHAQAIVICASDDYVNLTVAMRARDLNPDIRIIVRMWDDRFKEQLKKYVGVEAVLSASELAAPAFAGAAFGMEIAQTLKIRDEAYTIFRLTVEPGASMEGLTIDELQERSGIDIVLIERDDRVRVHPPGNIKVQAEDTLVIFARHAQILAISEGNRRKNGK